MTRLVDLEPRFLRVTGDRTFKIVETIGEAQGINFVCPKCFAANGNRREGVHGVICWSRSAGTPEDMRPGPGRWKLVGTSFDDLTLDADPPATARSVHLQSGCGWHGHVTNGDAT